MCDFFPLLPATGTHMSNLRSVELYVESRTEKLSSERENRIDCVSDRTWIYSYQREVPSGLLDRLRAQVLRTADRGPLPPAGHRTHPPPPLWRGPGVQEETGNREHTNGSWTRKGNYTLWWVYDISSRTIPARVCHDLEVFSSQKSFSFVVKLWLLGRF